MFLYTTGIGTVTSLIILFLTNRSNRKSEKGIMKTEVLQDNERLLLGIQANDAVVIEELFTRFRNPICTLLIKKGAQLPEAEDIFMDALEAIYRKLLSNELTIQQSSFQTYLTSICLRQWYKKCRRKKFDAKVTPEELTVLKHNDDLEQEIYRAERSKLFWDHFHQLEKDCQKVLQMALIEESHLQEVAEQMGYTYQYARKKKSRCHKRLVDNIKSDERFKELNG